MLLKKYIFRILAIYTMAVMFLPVFSYNFPTFLYFFRSPNFILPLWIIAVFFGNRNLLASKYLLIFYVFAGILFLGIGTFWSDIKVGYGETISFAWILKDIGGTLLQL